MDGSVRRNIALKLKVSTAQKSADSKKRREREQEENAEMDRSMDTPTSSISTIPAMIPTSRIAEGGGTLGLRWDYKVNLIGRAVQDPLLHICEICSLPVLIYGRMKRCRHAFCRDCSKKAGGICPKCREGEQIFEEATMGNVYICTNGGGRYDNKGCGRSYLSQRDLEAHIAYRHKEKLLTQPTLLPPTSVSGNPLPPFSFPPHFTFQPRPEMGLPAPPVGMVPPGLPPPGMAPPPFPPGALPPPPPMSVAPPPQGLRPPHLIPTVPAIVTVPQFPSQQQSPSFPAPPSTLPSNWPASGVFK